jgi:uncharacterized protein YpmS
MKINHNLSVVFSILILLAFAILACNLPVSTNSIKGSVKTVPTNPAADENQPSANSTLNSSNPMTITLTEGQLNAIVQQALQTNQLVQDVQIQLLEGQIIITGTVNQQGMSLPMRLTLEVSPDGQGGINYQIVSASVGPLPLPQGMRDQIEAMINQNLKTQVSNLTSSIYIETIAISNGVVNITGHAR